MSPKYDIGSAEGYGYYVRLYDSELADLFEDYLIEEMDLLPNVRWDGIKYEFHFDNIARQDGMNLTKVDESRLKGILLEFLEKTSGDKTGA
jgi:hypothetical protein